MITLLGPAYPWRGGIAHHTNMLARAFNEANIETEIITFSRQYPTLLYPGKNQKEAEGKGNFSAAHTEYMIDTLNPITWWRTVRYIVKSGSKQCVFKYWHFYFVPVFTFIAWCLRRHNIKITCIIDHIYSHESNLIDKIGTKLFFSQVDYMIIQSKTTYETFLKEFPKIPAKFIPLPSYNEFGSKIDMEKARQKLSLPREAKILLFFGFIRPYKGLDILIRNFSKLKKIYPYLYLAIVGECFGSFRPYQKLLDEYLLNNSVVLNIRYIESAEIPLWFSAVDIFMLPYTSAPNSGTLEIAKNYNVPVLASNIKEFLLENGKNGVVCVDFNNAPEVENAIEKLLARPSINFEIKNNWKNYIKYLLSIME